MPRGFRLTRHGREALGRARRILAEMADLELAVRHLDGLTGYLAIGVIPTAAPYILPLAMARLKGQNASIELRVREAQTATLLASLERGCLDAVVVASPVGPGFRVLPLIEDHFLLAGPRARLDAWAVQAKRLQPSELPGDELLLLDEGHCLADQALEVCGWSARRPADLGASSLSTLIGLAVGGFGFTLLPEIAAATEAREGLALMRFAPPEPARTLSLVVRKTVGTWDEALADLLRQALTF